MSFYHDNPLVSSQAFQSLIQERAQERRMKALEKCEEGRREIAARKSRNGVDPVALFPEETWLDILAFLTPEDRGNIWDIHPWFENLIGSNRNRDILLPQAIPFLLDKVKNNDISTVHRMDISESKLAPLVRLREVSKSLRRGVDRWFEDKIMDELHQNKEKPSAWNPVPGMTFHLCRDKDRLNQLIEFYRVPGRAFFVRSIDVVLSTDHFHPPMEVLLVDPHGHRNIFIETCSNFKTALITLLEQIGDQIWNFHLCMKNTGHFERIGLTVADHYTFLRNCCELMPNLKRLEVDYQLEGNNVPENLPIFIEASQFPTLKKLVRFDVKQSENITATPLIYDAILKANPHMKMLKFQMEDNVLRQIRRGTFEALQQLKYFSWKNMTPMSSLTSTAFTPPLNWPLKCLKMHWQSSTLKELFRFLENYPNLEKVQLLLLDVTIGKEVGFLNLPNLTHFDIDFHGGTVDYDKHDLNFFFSLQFLLQSKKLKSLQWSHLTQRRPPTLVECLEWESQSNMCPRHRRPRQGYWMTLPEYLESHEYHDKMIDFRGGMRDLKSSNIWKVFPELEEIQVGSFRRASAMMRRRYRR